jgi:sucrose-6-phosphate hydrolase SacC (GH32 family)
MGLLAERRVIADNPHGWAGVLSLPRVLDLDADGRLLMDPVPEVCSTHEADWEYHGALSARAPLIPAELYEDSMELVMEIDPGSAGEVGVKLCCSPGGEEETVIRYDTENQKLIVDTRKASLNPDTGRSVNGTPVALKSGELLRLHVFLDRSTVEVFANRRACVSDRIYPTRDDSLGVQVYARADGASIKSLKAWRKKSVFFAT